MIKIIWFVAALTADGQPLFSIITETTTFNDPAACAVFGKEMTPRVADYGRGSMSLDWHDKVEVAFECKANGQPA